MSQESKNRPQGPDARRKDTGVRRFIENIVSANNVFIDASSLLHKRFRAIERDLFDALRMKRQRLIIPKRAIEKLERERSAEARYALKQIQDKAKKGLVDIFGDDSDEDTASTLLSIFTKHAGHHALALITQDGDLTEDILQLNERASLKGVPSQQNRKVSVYRINDDNNRLEVPFSGLRYVDIGQLAQEESLLFIDTSTLLEEQYPGFEKELFTSLKNEGKQLLVLDNVVSELQFNQEFPVKQKGSERWDSLAPDEKQDRENLAKRADYALKSLRQYQLMGLVVIPGDDSSERYVHIADREFLTVFTELRKKHDIVLFTQDVSLAHDALKLNQSRSQKGRPLSVYSLNRRTGKLSVQLGDVEAQKQRRAEKENLKT